MMTIPAARPAQDSLRELEALTRSYARYSRSAGGLGSILGGVLCLISYFVGALAPLTPAVRIGLVAIPFAWLLAKGWLTHRYYQRFGHVEEQERPNERLTHRLCTAVTLLIALGIVASILVQAWPRWGSLPAGKIGYIALVLTLPIVVWRWLRSPLDFIVGVFLFCQAALASAGVSYPLIGTTHSYDATLMSLIALMFPLAALAMIRAGIGDHRRFLDLRTRLDELRSMRTPGL